jgi:hypothetical protein
MRGMVSKPLRTLSGVAVGLDLALPFMVSGTRFPRLAGQAGRVSWAAA